MSGKNVPNISINKTLYYSFENCGKYKERLDDSLEVKNTSFVTKQCRCARKQSQNAGGSF